MSITPPLSEQLRHAEVGQFREAVQPVHVEVVETEAALVLTGQSEGRTGDGLGDAEGGTTLKALMERRQE